MRNKNTFIVIGRSGCGKGTQIKLLKEYLENCGAEDVLHVTMGDSFRNMMQREEYIPKISKEINDKGGLMPEFLAVWNWSNILINQLKENSTIIFDGAPRKIHEAHLLDSALNYLYFKRPTVIHIDVSEDWSRERLSSRGRDDDTKESIDRRMSWYESDVMPVVEYYKHNTNYEYININGEDTIENINLNIIKNLVDKI